MFVKVTDGEVDRYPYTMNDLLRDNPQTSFPKNSQLTDFSGYGVHPVEHDSEPAYDANTQRISHSKVPVMKNGAWVITKTVVALNDEQISARYAAHATKVREERDALLADSDWTQMNDSPLDTTARTSWATYRQELRDISTQSGFPYSVTYPEKPSV